MSKNIVGFKPAERVTHDEIAGQVVEADGFAGEPCRDCGKVGVVIAVETADHSYDLCVNCLSIYRLEPIYEEK